MTPNDIKFFHSGGGSNCDPANDLGGAISSCELSDGLGTLFESLTPKQSRIGLIDYRCFYIKNTSTETLRDAKVYIDSEEFSGSYIELGILSQNEIQAVNVNGTKPPNEGEAMTLTVPGYGSFTVFYHPNISEWQGRFLTEIRGIDGLGDVVVTATGSIGFPTDVTFIVDFIGSAGSHDISPFTVTSEDLDGCTVMVNITQNGFPINTTACTIANKQTAPSCAVFGYPLRGNPFAIGDLQPNDYLPLWVRRTTPGFSQDDRKMTVKLTRDNFRINVDGKFP